MDKFRLIVTDFYEELNEASETICYQEFGSFDLADIQQLRAILYLVNHSLSQFIDCLGLWMSFYPQFWDEIARKLLCDPEFSLFEHEGMYRPIIEKLKEVDPQSLHEKKFFWHRVCEPNII